MRTTRITEMCQAHADGTISREEIVELLVHWPYAPEQPRLRRQDFQDAAAWWEYVEGRTHDDPGTFHEVVRARNRGLLDWDTFLAINDGIAATAPSLRRRSGPAPGA